MIKGLSHITFVVKDLEKSMAFFRELFDAKEVYSSGDHTFSLSREKFFTIGDLWFAIMEGKPVERSYHHVAFDVCDDEFEAYLEKLRQLNIETRPPRQRKEEEGKSVYFYDYDNNLFEIHCGTLERRLKFYNARLGFPC